MKKFTFILCSIFFLIAYFYAFYRYVNLMPYQRDFLQGDAAYHININYNISQYFSPESTLWSNGENWEAYKDNPFVGKKTDYTSSLLFWGRTAFTAGILVPLIYSISPAPPMNILAIIIIVLILGYIGISIGAYWLTKSYLATFIACSVYLLSPWVVCDLFERGFWDLIGYGFFPLVLSGALKEQWKLFTVMAALFAGISLPVAMLTLVMCGGIFFFYRKHQTAFIVSSFCLALIFFAAYIYPFCTAEHLSNQTGNLLTNNFPNIIERINQKDSYLSKIFFSLLEGMSKQLLLPVILAWFLARKVEKKFFYFATFIALAGFAMILAREGTHRNYFFVVPAFYIGLVASSIIFNQLKKFKIPGAALIIFTASFLPHFFTDTVNRIDGLYVISYALGIKKYSDQELNEQKEIKNIVDEISQIVPEEQGIVFGDMRQLEGAFCNRRYCWYLGYHPKGAEYFLVQEPSRLNLDNMQLVKKFSSPFELFLYKNIDGNGFSRNEPIIGLNPLKRAIGL